MNLKRYDLIAIIFFSVMLTLVGVQAVFSFTGTNNVISPGALEITDINATNYYKNDVLINDRLEGNFTGIGLIGDTIDTGHGANELYDMDQHVLESSSVTFDGITTPWIILDGVNGSEFGSDGNPFDQDLNTTDDVTFNTIDTGHGANELYDMDQHVLEASAVTFASIDTGYINATEYYFDDVNRSDVLAFPELPANYIIFKDGSLIKAKNGETGQIDYSSTIAHDVINNVITDVPNGAKISVKNGTYEIGVRTLLQNCDSGWVTADGEVTVTHDSGDKQEGTASVQLDVTGAFTTGLMAYYNFGATQDISSYEAIGVWFEPNIELPAGALEICFDDSANCASPEITLDLRHPEDWDTDVWKYINPPTDASNYHNPIDLSSMSALYSIGIRAVSDPGACILNMDEVSVIDGSIRGKLGVTLEGCGNGTIFKLGDRVNNNMFFIETDDFTVRSIFFYGNGENQDSIDGCTVVHVRGGDRFVAEFCNFKDVKGCAVKFRDNVQGKVLNCYGDSIENPFVSVSYSSYNLVSGNYVTNITDDDPYWSIGDSCFNKITGNTFEGPSGSNGVRIQGSSGLLSIGNIVENNIMKNFTQSGVYLGAYAPYTIVSDNIIMYMGERGIYGSSTSPRCTVTGNVIYYTGKDGIDTNSADWWTITGNTVTDVNTVESTHNAIRLYSSTNCSVMGNIIDDTRGSPWNTRAIREESGDYNIIQGNICGPTTYDPRVLIVGTYTVASDNQGFITKNSGTALIDSTTWVQADHGLSGTPTMVTCSFNSTAYDSYSWSASSTQITINVKTSGTYSVTWLAVYDPA